MSILNLTAGTQLAGGASVMTYLSAMLLALIGGFLAVVITAMVDKLLRSSLYDFTRSVHREVPARGERFQVRNLRLVWWALLSLLLAPVLTSCLGLGSVYGLLVPFLVPAVYPFYLRMKAKQREKVLEESALAFFHTLSGYTRVGVALPTALFRLAKPGANAFAALLADDLALFHQGRPLPLCLQRFRKRSVLRQVGLYILLLEMAYQQGLATGPLLTRAIPALEQDLQAERLLKSLKQQALVPILTACLLPWVLGGTLASLQPEIVWGWWGDGGYRFVFAVLIIEILEVVVVWQATRFH